MSDLLNKWNVSPFSVYTSEEKSTLKLMKELGEYTGILIKDQDSLNKAMTILQEKVSNTDKFIGENIVDKISEMVEDGTFETMVNVGLSENFRPNFLPSSINANSIENRIIDVGYESMQGGTFKDGMMYYWLISDTLNKQKLIVYDVENRMIVRSKEFSNLGHCSDCCIYNNKMYLTSNTIGLIYEIDLITLILSNKSLSGVGVCQGVAMFGDKLVIKEDDNLTIKIYDLILNTVIKSYTLQIPINSALYKQGIDVIGNYIIDVRGIPASGYFYNIDNGQFASSFKFDTIDTLQRIGENEFLANDGNGKFYFGSYGSFNGVALITTGFVDIKKTTIDITPFISSNLSGVDSVYVNNTSTSSIEDGTIDNPFKTMEQALLLLGERKIRRLRITGGSYSNVAIQHKGTIEIFFSGGAVINNLSLNYTNAILNNANLTGTLSSTGSQLSFAGSLTIDSGVDYCINAIYSDLKLIPTSASLTTTKPQNIKVDRCIVLCSTNFTIEGINYSIITNNISQTTYGHNLDNTCLWNGKIITGITPLYTGSVTVDNVPPHTEIQVRARSGNYSTNLTVSQLSSAGSSRQNVINFYIEISGVPYLNVICFTFSSGVLSINYNKMINIVNGTITNHGGTAGNFSYIDQIAFKK